jgi:hypothetical protein
VASRSECRILNRLLDPAFRETVLWVECDQCGRVFSGPGINKVMSTAGHSNVGDDCLRQSGSKRQPLLRVRAVEAWCFVKVDLQGYVW